MMRRDASKHPSPNGGYTEATVAGALHIRLGGLNYYFGKPSFRAYMGESLKTLAPLHIKQVIILMYGTTVVFLLLSCMILFLGGMDS
jgi:adenosylcobinamide-phosphate synthase